MNIQSRTIAHRRTPRRRQGAAISWSTKLYIFLYLLLMSALLFGIANYRIGLNRQLNDLRRETNRVKSEIYELDRDIQALKIARERLSSWDNIRAQIARHNLQFRAPDPSQVRKLTVRHRVDVSGRIAADYTEQPRGMETAPRLSLNRP